MEASDIFKKRFRDLIAARGVTYPEIAAACGISESLINSYLKEAAKPNPQASTLIALGKFFGVTPDYLLGIDSRPPPTPPDPPPPRRPTELEIAVHLFDMFEGMNDHRNQKAVDLFKKALTASDAQLEIWLRDFDAMKDELLGDPNAGSSG